MSPPPSRWRIQERPLRLLIWLLIALAAVEIYRSAEFLVIQVFNVAILFVFASIIAMLLTPVVDWVAARPPFRGRRGLAVFGLVAAALVIAVAAAILLTPTLVSQAQQLPDLGRHFQSQIDRLQATLNQRGIPIDFRAFVPSGTGLALPSATVLTGAVTAVLDAVLTVVIAIYLLIQGRDLLAAARNLFPDHTHLFDFTLIAVGTTIASYVRGQLIMSTLIGVYIGLSMSLLGVHFAVLLGILAFFLEFLPMVGTAVSMVLVIAVALIQSPSLALFAAAVGLGGHALEAYIVGPRINAHVTRLHPLVAMAVLIVGAEIGGIIGALFAVPMAAVGNIFLGALYRSRRGEAPLSTDEDGAIHADALPRLGEEISAVDDGAGIVDEPLPHAVPGPVGRSR